MGMEPLCIVIEVITEIYMYDKMTNTCRYTHTHTDCIIVNFLVSILHYAFVKCNHWGRLYEEYM